MIRKFLSILFIFLGVSLQAQTRPKEFRSKTIQVQSDTIQIDSLSIQPLKFSVFNANKKQIPASAYQVDFAKAQLIINSKKYPTLIVEYYRYPSFLTKTYTPFDKRLLVPNTTNTGKLYSLTTNRKATQLKLFDGLKTQGFITRGITVGNNQNAVTNSSLDLTLSGKLSSTVGIRANIFDTNIPLQQNGYSQNITDFDRIFVELFSKNWRVKGGDLSLVNTNSYFLNFEKQVAGLEVAASINKKTKIQASGAIVRGRFTAFNFVGIENNQGPYKLMGPNNEPGIVIVNGSDKVFVNGILINRGETKDYVIDYNLAEIRFNTTYPITNNMRIRVEFQFADRNYTRFITYEKASFTGDKFRISGHFYSENDAKNQPLQQSLTTAQKQILKNAGNDVSKMIAPSAFRDEYNANRIQYKKVQQGTVEVFQHSTDANDEVYTVNFTNVGTNKGEYSIDKTTAIGTIFKYVGPNLGSYAPIIRLAAPSSLQVAAINTAYQPNTKTTLAAEVAYSNNDANLFSTLDDNQNKRLASKLNWTQTWIDRRWQFKSDLNYTFIQDNFQTVQRFQTVEFNRDWNLQNPTGDQNQLGALFSIQNKKNDFISYGFQLLNFSNNFSGNKHNFRSKLQFNNTSFSLESSLLNNNSSIAKDQFFRLRSKVEHHFQNSWVGIKVRTESNDQKDKNTLNFKNTSHRFQTYESYIGFGDSTRVFAKFGINHTTNDSIRNNRFTQINNRKTFFINSRLIQQKNTNLSIYANYRVTENAFAANTKSLHSRINYNQRLFNDFLLFSTLYETSSGNIAQQDFIYVKTEPGQGFYTWIDYNKDGIQQFEEFEVAQFRDQADYLRVALPNLRFLPTQRAKWKQSITINASKWANNTGIRKLLSHFYNQTHFIIDNEQERIGNSFNLNPFDLDTNKLLGLTFNLRNSVYFNRNLQNYSFVYTYGKSRNKRQFSIGTQENNTFIHQLEFHHKLTKFWLFDITGFLAENKLETQNLANRNYLIKSKELHPKLSFLYHKDHRFSIFYQYNKKENLEKDFEQLRQQKFGLEYFFVNGQQRQITANLSVFLNDFTGNVNTPVGYQMLEGLQAGRNYTWNTVFRQKLNSFLHLNLNYFGRKSENSRAIHTGTVQLKAVF